MFDRLSLVARCGDVHNEFYDEPSDGCSPADTADHSSNRPRTQYGHVCWVWPVRCIRLNIACDHGMSFVEAVRSEQTLAVVYSTLPQTVDVAKSEAHLTA